MHISDAKSVTKETWKQRAADLQPETRLFIHGEFVEAAEGGTFGNHNPATGALICEMSEATQVDVDKAVASSRRAFKSGVWSAMPPRDRMAVLEKFSHLIEEHGQEFALLDSVDMGKPLSDMFDIDVPFSALTFKYFAETIDKIEGKVTNTDADSFHAVMREPLGVIACIVPWNYPLMMAAWKIAPALAAGNTVVLKPAEQSPMSALLLAKLFKEAGGPDGVLNVLNGFGETVGQALAKHMDVAKVAFTGSTEVGKLMYVYSGQSNMKRVSAECGGKTPNIIMDDVEDLDVAVQYAVYGIYGNQGEVCNAGSRILVHQDIYEAFIEKFVAKTREAFRAGDPLDPDTSMGSLVTKGHQERVLGYINAAKQEGANLVFGGQVPTGLEAGCYVEPTLFRDVNMGMTLAREEIFGPVAAVVPFSSEEEAIAIANDTEYGLAAAIWTTNVKRAHRMASAIEAGIVWVNCFDHGDMTQPWGGYKQSGHGRDKCFDSMLENMQTKSVWFHIGD